MEVRKVDLSHPMYHCMPGWPTSPNFLIECVSWAARDGCTMHVVRQMHTHSGTHVDVPLHWIPEAKTIDQIHIEKFVGEGMVLDLSFKKSGEQITVEDLQPFDHEIREDDVVLLHTGWDKKRGFNPQYLFEWPHLSEDVAKYFVDKKIKALGVDTLSVSGWNGEVSAHGPVTKVSLAAVHQILLKAEIIIVEELANLDKVLENKRTARAFFIFAPLNIKGAEGAPCRALALIVNGL